MLAQIATNHGFFRHCGKFLWYDLHQRYGYKQIKIIYYYLDILVPRCDEPGRRISALTEYFVRFNSLDRCGRSSLIVPGSLSEILCDLFRLFSKISEAHVERYLQCVYAH